MALNFTQVTTPVTRDEAATDLISMLDSLGFQATSWQQSSIPHTLVLLGAHLYAKASDFWAYIATQPYIDTAEGKVLTKLSASHYDNTRAPATNTQIRGTFTTAAGEGPHSVDVGDVVVSDGEHTFRNVAGLGVSYPTSFTSAGPVTLLMEAEVAGAATNVGNDTVTTMVTTYAGVTVTNDIDESTGTSVITVGTDEESDATLEERDATKWGTLSIETTKAGAINVALNASAGIVKADVDDQNPNGAGTAIVYVAAAASVVGGADVTLVQTALSARFFDNSGASPRVEAQPAPGIELQLTGTVYYDASFQEDDVISSVEAALLQFLTDTPLGGWSFTTSLSNVVRLNDVETAIKNALVGIKAPVKTVVIDTPTFDLAVPSFNVVTKPATWGLDYQAI